MWSPDIEPRVTTINAAKQPWKSMAAESDKVLWIKTASDILRHFKRELGTGIFMSSLLNIIYRPRHVYGALRRKLPQVTEQTKAVILSTSRTCARHARKCKNYYVYCRRCRRSVKRETVGTPTSFYRMRNTHETNWRSTDHRQLPIWMEANAVRMNDWSQCLGLNNDRNVSLNYSYGLRYNSYSISAVKFAFQV